MGIAHQTRRQVRWAIELQQQPFFLGARAHQGADLTQQAPEIEMNGLDGQLAGFNLGKIKNVIDDIQQGSS